MTKTLGEKKKDNKAEASVCGDLGAAAQADAEFVKSVFYSGADNKGGAGNKSGADNKSSAGSFLRLSVDDLDFRPQLDCLPVLLCGLNDDAAATKAKQYLGQFFSPDTLVFCGKDNAAKTTLEKLCVRDCADGRALIIPEKGFDKQKYTFGDLIRIMERLTGEGGCPWDKEQTHKSIRSNMIEEAYEAAQAIDSGDKENFIEELGDVMLQSVFHADIARRSGEFELGDILNALCRKLYTRHTHIFGDKKASDGRQALKNWEDAKAAEKAAEKGAAEIKSYEGLPGLMRAQKICKKLKDKAEDLGQREERIINAETPLKYAADTDADADFGRLFKYVADTDTDTDFGRLFKYVADTDADFGRLLYNCAAACQESGIDAETELNAYLNKLVKNANK